jgi:hypothetical protein
MSYGDILKRAWNVTWRYKALWVLGLFVGGASYSNSGANTSSTTPSSLASGNTAVVQSFLAQWGWLIVLGVFVALILGLAIAVIALAARGGLIHLVNEAEEGRPVKLGAGWRAGFSKWGRLFGVSLLVALPLLVIVLIIAVVVGVSAFSAFGAYMSSGSTRTLLSTIAGPLVGSVCLLLVLVAVAVILAVILGPVSALALRYVMLQDRHVIESLKQGWSDLWSKRGAFLMFLVMFGIGIGVAIVFAIVAGILGVPALLISGAQSAFSGTAPAAGAGSAWLGFVGLIMLVPAAVYGTFVEASWTIFFRRMTGMEPRAVPAAVEPAPAAYPMASPASPAYPMYAPEPPAPTIAPEPPAAPEAPAPPAAPEPPAPPADV